MKNFVYQVNSTEPGCWRPVTAESHSEAAVQIVSKFPPGEVRIHVAMDSDKNKWENGSPKIVHNFLMKVEKKK